MSFALARSVADSVLYEGYVLYPYRASAVKNRFRWQFGIVAPRAWTEAGGTEPSSMRTECLVEGDLDARLEIRVRFLQAQARIVERDEGRGFVPVESAEAGGELRTSWDEGVEREIGRGDVRVRDLVGKSIRVPIAAEGVEHVETIPEPPGRPAVRVRRRRWPIRASLALSAEAAGEGLFRISAEIENATPWKGDAGDRESAMRVSLIGAHTLLAVSGGRFVSLLDPPAGARAAAEACRNANTWPVLIGGPERETMLSSPIILYDYPSTAPESPGDLCDATEIDEILTLRIRTMTDAEKREARSTDERSRRILDRSDGMPDAVLGSLHGAFRPAVGPADAADAAFSPDAPFWAPEADAAPETASVSIAGVEVRRGSRVVLRPGPRGDSMDMFLAGRRAVVESVHESIDGETFAAVTLEEDPAAELHSWYGRYFYFRPGELEPDGEVSMNRDGGS